MLNTALGTAILLCFSHCADRSSGLVALRDANMNSLRRGITNLRTLIDSQSHRQHTHAAAEQGEWNNNLEDLGGARGALTGAIVPQLLLNVECRVVVVTAASVKIHVSTVDAYDVRKHCSTQTAKRSEDGAFRASMCCCVDYKLQHHSRMEVRVYREDDLRARSK
ncbi:hypothetical protein XENORESO_020980, partial [Xenotaenia resolanae]